MICPVCQNERALTHTIYHEYKLTPVCNQCFLDNLNVVRLGYAFDGNKETELNLLSMLHNKTKLQAHCIKHQMVLVQCYQCGGGKFISEDIKKIRKKINGIGFLLNLLRADRIAKLEDVRNGVESPYDEDKLCKEIEKANDILRQIYKDKVYEDPRPRVEPMLVDKRPERIEHNDRVLSDVRSYGSARERMKFKHHENGELHKYYGHNERVWDPKHRRYSLVEPRKITKIPAGIKMTPAK